MIENTPENKARFFAQYWGQKILIGIPVDEPATGFRRVWASNIERGIAAAYLDLKPLSQITDEDAVEFINILTGLKGRFKVGDLKIKTIANRFGRKWRRVTSLNHSFEHETGQFYCNFGDHCFSPVGSNQEGVLKLFDFLRSKGYALPYMGVSVEQQIEWGWVKLKEEEL